VDGRLLPQIPFHVCRSARWFLGKLPILLCDQVRSKLVLDVGCMWGGKEASGSRAKQYCMKLERGIEHIAIHFLTGFSRATGLCGPLKSATSPCPSTWRRRNLPNSCGLGVCRFSKYSSYLVDLLVLVGNSSGRYNIVTKATLVCHYNSICGLNLHELCLCNISLFTYRLSKLLYGKHQCLCRATCKQMAP